MSSIPAELEIEGSSGMSELPVTYQISHMTRYRYSAPVAMCQNQLRLTPRDDAGQLLRRHKIEILPKPTKITSQSDFFGNGIHYFELHQPHTELTIGMHATIEVPRVAPEPTVSSPAWTEIQNRLANDYSNQGTYRYQFAFPSSLVPRCAFAQKFARDIFRGDRPIYECVVELNTRLHEYFDYSPNSTTINTPLDVVFSTRKGVCQDFAHAAIACLRSIGLAARYVSGYLKTIAPSEGNALVGADASHAWVSVYMGSLGWIEIDPTNNMVVGNQHIVLAYGRDFRDVTPINGLFTGAEQQSLDVAVQVRLL